MNELAELLKKSFITCNSGGNEGAYIKIKCDNLIDAHEIHRALFKLVKENTNEQTP